MRYNEIIFEANYRNKIDTSRTYPTQAEFDSALKSKFGTVGPTKDSSPQAGGGVYIISTKGIVGYKVPNVDSPEGFVWYLTKEPFMPASKKKPEAATPQPVAKPIAPKVEPKVAPKTANVQEALGELLRYVASIKSRNMWGNYDARGPERDGDGWIAEIRDWGNWEIPRDADLEPGDEEDYDWEELSDESGAKLKSIVDDFSKRYPSIEFYWQTGEKNWIYFHAKAK
jgi:hypothetical protein